MPTQTTRRLTLAIVLTISWTAVYVYFLAAQFDPFISDVRAYWGYSQVLDRFNVFHLPAYSATIGVLHWAFPAAQPLLLMLVINIGCWALAVLAIYDIFEHQKAPSAWIGTILFALFPFYGVVSVVYPLADTPAAACLVIGLWAHFRNKRWAMVLAFSVGLLTHKLIWPFIALALLIGVMQKRISLWSVVLTCMPLAIYIVLGTGFHHDILWLFRESGASATGDTRVLPVLDAIFGPLFTGKISDILQFSVVFPIFALACILLLNRSWKSEPILLALLIPIILIGVFFTEGYAQVPLRLGRLLVIPLMFYLAQRKRPAFLERPAFIVTATITLIVSQVVFAFYMSEFFFK